MQALFLASLCGCEGSFEAAFFLNLTGDETEAVLEAFFLACAFFEFTAIEVAALLPRFFFAEDFGASGDMDLSRAGS